MQIRLRFGVDVFASVGLKAQKSSNPGPKRLAATRSTTITSARSNPLSPTNSFNNINCISGFSSTSVVEIGGGARLVDFLAEYYLNRSLFGSSSFLWVISLEMP